jgi:hypothetical protein
MIELVKTISAFEVRSYHLNLSDDHDRRFGASSPSHRTQLVVLDGKGSPTQCQEHHDNQLWGTLRNPFIDNGIQPGDKVSMVFDPSEMKNGLHKEFLECRI